MHQYNKVKCAILSLLLCFLFSACSIPVADNSDRQASVSHALTYTGEAYSIVNNNIPDFTEDDLTTESFEDYRELDALGRCGTAFACIGADLMPTEKRGNIGSVKPSGWHTVKYNGVVDGNYLYNRCHLIGFQLTAENANEKNLITGTRYLNVEGMLPFENMVADYIKETDNHVLYRVTPIFEGDNLVANAVQMEAMSVEDNGDGILFNVCCFNVQPGIVIDYTTGDSWLADEQSDTPDSDIKSDAIENNYILNTNSKKFHLTICPNTEKLNDQNRENYHGSREQLLRQGYAPCKICNP